MMTSPDTKIIFVICLCSFMIIAACGDKQDPVHVFDGDGSEVVTYSSDIKPLLENNCLRCHSVSVSGSDRNGAPVDINFDTYDDIYSHADIANQRIQSGTMPPTGSLSDQEKALFQQWIADGKLENAPAVQSLAGSKNIFADYETWAVIDNTKYPVNLSLLKDAHQGHDPDHIRYIYANTQKAGDSYMPGSIFVMETFRWNNGEKEYADSEGIVAMVKRGDSFNPEDNNWEWFILNNEDISIYKRGANLMNGSCCNCHRQANIISIGMDYVFAHTDNTFNNSELNGGTSPP
jgi:hypothetical protein